MMNEARAHGAPIVKTSQAAKFQIRLDRPIEDARRFLYVDNDMTDV